MRVRVQWRHTRAREHGASRDVRSHRHSRIFELSRVLVRVDHVATRVVSADQVPRLLIADPPE